MKILVLLVMFILVACQKNEKPEIVLKNYMQDRLAGKLTSKEEILSYLTGKYWAEVNSLNEEEFKKFESLTNIKQNSFKVISNKCIDLICYITYSISYSTLDQNTKTFETEVKKVAELRLEDNQWKISDISTIKTFHESLEPIKPLE
jgi:hypothetical protein